MEKYHCHASSFLARLWVAMAERNKPSSTQYKYIYGQMVAGAHQPSIGLLTHRTEPNLRSGEAVLARSNFTSMARAFIVAGQEHADRDVTQ